jgi:S-adenosylmethionine synthetase
VPAFLANRLAERLAAVRGAGKVPYLYPDGKVQVSLRYENDRPTALTHVVVSAHHHADADLARLRRDLRRLVVEPVLAPTGLLGPKTEVMINPVGAFAEGGPRADAGLTGRKITVDCYGAACPHGGSAFSGKDPTKPDRSGSYGARWVAKNVVAAGLARRCAVEAAYVIGVPEPISVEVDSFGTGVLPDDRLTGIVRDTFDLSPAGINETLDLRRPIYAQLAAYGHFGRVGEDFTWETTDRVDALKERASAAGATRVASARKPTAPSTPPQRKTVQKKAAKKEKSAKKKAVKKKVVKKKARDTDAGSARSGRKSRGGGRK